MRRKRSPAWLLRRISFWPPFLGAGIRVKSVSADCRTVTVEMRLRFYNCNHRGVHFGGSLYSMCDPFFVLILANQLGPNYSVWDKAANINFKCPSSSTVRAQFYITPERIEEIRRAADIGEKTNPVFAVEVVDDKNEVVAQIEKQLSVKRIG